MHFDFPTYKQEVINQVRKRALIFNIICVLAAVLPALIFFFYTVQETNELGVELLGQETYSDRMNDSYLFAIIMFAVIFTFIALPGYLFMKRFFQNYINVVNSLTPQDLQTYKTINDKLRIIEKFLPSFIIQNNTIVFFTLFGLTQIRFSEIQTIDTLFIRTGRYAGYILTIKTLQKKYKFRLSTNIYQFEILFYNAIVQNPEIKINQSRNV